MSNIEDTTPVDILVSRVWAGMNYVYPHLERMVSEMKAMRNANALLRAECEAWRHRYESKCPADAGTAAHTAYYTEAAKSLGAARAATDAAGALKGVQS